MGPRAAGESVSLHGAGETPSLGLADHVHDLTRFKDVHRHRLTNFILPDAICLDFLQPPSNLAAPQVSGLGLVGLAYAAKSQLHRFVTVSLRRAYLGNGAGAGLNYGYGHDLSGVVEHLSHADFLAEKRLEHFVCLSVVC